MYLIRIAGSFARRSCYPVLLSGLKPKALLATKVKEAQLASVSAGNKFFFSTASLLQAEENNDIDEEEGEIDSDQEFIRKHLDEKDRSREIPLEISIKYMESVAFKTAYGDEPIWKKYRRNFIGTRLPLKTRETCIRQGRIATDSPCPICRDQYLVVDYRNKALLKHFIDPYTGKILHPNQTHVCQKQWRKLQIHLEKARDHGWLDVDVPQVEYDYKEYKN